MLTGTILMTDYEHLQDYLLLPLLLQTLINNSSTTVSFVMILGVTKRG